MNNIYAIADTSKIISPGLVVFRDLVEKNLRSMVEMAGNPDRLRPHCKTHKMARVTELALEMGITRHKCATLAEAEMLARAGVTDIMLAYNIVGTNIHRVADFVRQFPQVQFIVTADHEKPIEQLGRAMQAADATVGVALDLDCGMHRTGVPIGPRAKQLYRQIADTAGLQAAGLHAYDGHHHEHSLDDRRRNIEPEWNKVLQFRDELLAAGLAVPRIVASGTPGFPVHAAHDDPSLELSPGTTVLYDAGSVVNYPDLPFTPAALVLTRVISRPGEDLVTFDVGSKAIAADPPMEKRASFPGIPDAQSLIQNEEHLVIRTRRAGEFAPGDEQLAIPWHVCPTSALHREAYVVSGGQLVDHWEVTARDRWLTV